MTHSDMNSSADVPASQHDDSVTATAPTPQSSHAAPNQQSPPFRSERSVWRWAAQLIFQPLLLLASLAAAMLLLGWAQQAGWISSGSGPSSAHQTASSGDQDSVDYICPMMCTPPQKEPGRCPVCAMELVPATGTGNSDPRAVHITPAARRVANIQTVSVRSLPLTRTIRAVGRLTYDESSLRTIAAWANGRIEKLYADYTGVIVKKNDHLALLYSPELYSGQVELLAARQAAQANRNRPNVLTLADGSLYESARERLIELGMTPEQIAEIEASGKATSRLRLCAPISGTVIEKLATEGDYVKTGQTIFRLADLSTVWLVLELFPEDAALIRYGQKVRAEVQSLPGRTFEGRVAFVNPHVNETTRTVGIRVVIENPRGDLRAGDFAKAQIEVPITSGDIASSPEEFRIYDPEIAGKWISPRHPHVIADGPGKCPHCGIDLVPASDFGFSEIPQICRGVLAVPRNALLHAGSHSVVYVETDPGRFEIRYVQPGPIVGDDVVLLSGVQAGENVAVGGNFLIDSQMQLAGNPSLIDPTRAIPPDQVPATAEMLDAIARLPLEDRDAATAQKVCPVAGFALGSMGPPVKVNVNGRDVYLCCEGCREGLLADPEKYLSLLNQGPEAVAEQTASTNSQVPPIGDIQITVPEVPVGISIKAADEKDVSTAQSGSPQLLPPAGLSGRDDAETIRRSLARLPEKDASQARAQRICPVAELKLGTMGPPVKVRVRGRDVFICCEACRSKLLADPDTYLARISEGVTR